MVSNAAKIGAREIIKSIEVHKNVIQNGLSNGVTKLGSISAGAEESSIIITAFGTGAVAPLIIAFNPFMKKDEETKNTTMFAGLRQLVSAPIAILVQLGVLTTYNRYMDTIFNEGKLGKLYDKSKLQDESHIRRKFKKQGVPKDRLEEEVRKEVAKQYDAVMKEIADERDAAMKKMGKTERKHSSEWLYDQAKKRAAKIASNIKFFKEITGLAIGTVTVIITCTLLNWSYPKLVKKFFPELCKEKGDKGGAK